MARRLIILVLALGVVWCGYWVVGSRMVRSGVGTWFAEAPLRQMQAENGGVSVRGFPYRFDVTIDRIRLADLDGRYAWQAPFVQLFALSYKPWHVVAAFANDQQLGTPLGLFDLASDRMRGSMVVSPNAALDLQRLRVEGQGLRLTRVQDQGLTGQALAERAVTVAGLNLATDIQDQNPQSHRIGVELTDVTLPARLAGAAGTAGQIARLRLDAGLEFSAPIRLQVQEVVPLLTRISLHEARVDWAEASISASGDLTPDAFGQAQGQLTLRIDNWPRGLQLLQDIGLLSDSTRRALERGLRVVARLGGDRNRIEVPLTLDDGQMRISFVPVGPAPLLR